MRFLNEELYERLNAYLDEIEGELKILLEKRPIESDLLYRITIISENVRYIKEELSEKKILDTVQFIVNEVSTLFIKTIEVEQYDLYIEKSKQHISVFRDYLDEKKGTVI